MPEFNKNIIDKCKKYINETDWRIIYRKYYDGKDNRNKVLVRDDAEEFTTDWVNTMDSFVDQVCLVVESDIDYPYGSHIVSVYHKINHIDYVFDFHYESLIPIELIEEYSNPSKLYNKRKFIYESNILNEEVNYFRTESELDNIIRRNPHLKEPFIKFGDNVKLKENSLDLFRNDVWLDNNNVGYDVELEEFISDALKQNKTLNVIGKFKGVLEDDNFPWWSTFDVDGDVIYIPDLLLKKIPSHPSYSRRDFVYEKCDRIENFKGKTLSWMNKESVPFVMDENYNIKYVDSPIYNAHSDIWIKEAEEEFRNDYYVDPKDYYNKFNEKPTNPITPQEIEKYYEGQADFLGYYSDLFLQNIEEIIDEYKYIGRLWKKSKVMSFWKYPEDLNNLKKIIKSIENVLNIEIWNDNEWYIEVRKIKDYKGDINKIIDTKQLNKSRGNTIKGKNGKEYELEYKIIPLKLYKSSFNPDRQDWLEHVKSPLLKNKKHIKGVGSSKKISSALPNELPVETRHRIYQESLSTNLDKQILFRPRSKEDAIKAQLILYKNGWAWGIGENQKPLYSDDLLLLTIKPDGRIYKLSKSTTNMDEETSDEIVMNFFSRHINPRFYYTDNIKELMKLINYRPTYNKKEFIYENIKKLKDFQ